MPKRKEIAEDDTGLSERDYVMARLAAARVSAQSAIESIDSALALFVEADEDPKGKERKELIGAALDAVGCATRALENAEQELPTVDFTEVEPWDEGDEDDEDDDDEESDDEEDD